MPGLLALLLKNHELIAVAMAYRLYCNRNLYQRGEQLEQERDAHCARGDRQRQQGKQDCSGGLQGSDHGGVHAPPPEHQPAPAIVVIGSVGPGDKAKQMGDDLAVAREELTTISTLLRSAAKRMEADLSVAWEELLSTGNAAPPSRKPPSASGGAGDPLRDGDRCRSKGFAEQQNPKTAKEMEAEIERAKQEL